MGISITAIITILIIAVILKIATKVIIKIVGFLIVVAIVFGYMYSKSIGPFKENRVDIYELKAKYCDNDADEDICECIIKLAENDMQSRFSKEELDTLSAQKLKAVYVLKKSLDETKEEAIACLSARGQAVKYKTFLHDFVPIQNEYLDLITDKANDLKENVKDRYESFTKDKNEIDDKY